MVSNAWKQQLPTYLILVGFLPFWWRFWQCINKFVKQGVQHQITNAGKYFSKLVPPFILLFYVNGKNVNAEGFYVWLTFQMIATLYCLVWDYYMDWGLFRSSKPGKYMLRDKIQYPQYFYYFAMVVNLLLRFYWTLGFFKGGFSKVAKDFELYAWGAMLAEAVRRSLWSLIRIENEFFHNFEKYRSVLVIPSLMDEV